MKNFLMNNKIMVYMLLPAILILAFFSIGFLNILNAENSKTIILMSLLVITPAMFFINGYLSRKFNKNILMYSIPTFISFTFVFFVWLNSSATIYYIMYLFFNMFGFSLHKLKESIEKNKERRLKESGFYGKK